MTPNAEPSLTDLCRHMVFLMAKGFLIPFFGAGVNLTNRPTGVQFELDGQYLPNADELSESIRNQFKYPWADKNLLRVSWFAAENEKTGGKDALYEHLHNIFSRKYDPTDVHKFFARLPKRLADKGYVNRHQVLVTTNYDELLERAFDAEGEPYDIFSYVQDSETREEVGNYKHIPYREHSTVILKPDEFYTPIKHTVILKIHGAVDRTWDHSSFVITEDDYINYVTSTNPNKIPAVLREHMVRRRFLYLGYSLSDWNFRVLLKSFKDRSTFHAKTWAIMKDHEDWDPLYWERHNVKLIKQSLKDYIDALDKQLEKFPPAKVT